MSLPINSHAGLGMWTILSSVDPTEETTKYVLGIPQHAK